MLRSNLSINDSDPVIGVSPLVLSNPGPSPDPQPTDPLQPLALYYRLLGRIEGLEEYAVRLELRIVELEKRTWWSMLKAQVKGWFKRD